MATLFTRMKLGLTAFRKGTISASIEGEDLFTNFDARKLRYNIFWSFYENTAYDDIHKWANKYKTDYALYQYVRNIYNPSYRLGEFWKTYLMGGRLDPMAGDGLFTKSSIPIWIPKDNEANDESLREAISQVWTWSNWNVNKDIFTLYGSVFGDVVLSIVDDPDSGQVYFEVRNPMSLKEVEYDKIGNVKSYIIEEERRDPESTLAEIDNRPWVVYKEEAFRDGDAVVYETSRNDAPYDWNEGSGNGDTWREDYGFIPMVVVQHNNVGLDWGWSELMPGQSKFREVDDLSSKLHDHIRKGVDPAWFFSGVSKSKVAEVTNRVKTTPTADNPQPGREELPAIYATDPRARASALVADLDLESVVASLKEMLAEVERDYPELQMDIWRAVQTNSGRALRLARQRSEVKVIQRRANYDSGLTRGQQMAVSIGAMRGYVGFDKFNLEQSFEVGALDHFIGDRTVYEKDVMDQREEEEAFWKNAQEAIAAGVPLSYWLERQGWKEDEIAKLEKAIEEQPEPEIEQDQDDSDREQVDNDTVT